MGYTRFFGRATNTPQASAEALADWWGPDLGRIPEGGYCGFKVRVHDTKITAFKFDLLPRTPGGADEILGLEVNLTNIEHAWPAQSSAVHACLQGPCPLHEEKPTRYGYLLLSNHYFADMMIADVGLYADDPDGKGKWPFGTDIWMSLLARFIRDNADGMGGAIRQATALVVSALQSRMNGPR